MQCEQKLQHLTILNNTRKYEPPKCGLPQPVPRPPQPLCLLRPLHSRHFVAREACALDFSVYFCWSVRAASGLYFVVLLGYTPNFSLSAFLTVLQPLPLFWPSSATPLDVSLLHPKRVLATSV